MLWAPFVARSLVRLGGADNAQSTALAAVCSQGMGTHLLVAGALISFAVAAFHVVLVFYGAPALRYFGAGETLARMADEGSPFPALVTLAVAVVFVVFGLYALAAAHILAGLPFVYGGTFAVSAIYTLRGLMAVTAFFLPRPRFILVTSVISLAIGLLHFAGLYWNQVATSAGR